VKGPARQTVLIVTRKTKGDSKEGSLMGEVSSKDVQPRAQTALASSPIHELRDLEVEQQNGALVIRGTVSTFYYKQLAQEVVRAVCREIELVNSVHVW
jgi:osmotically-inducible protein OsmY